MNSAFDNNTTFSSEDKSSSITLTVVPSTTPVINFVNLTDNLI
jgi:hypothetical protein